MEPVLWHRYRVWGLITVCIGLQWGLGLWNIRFPLWGDEALYAFWARHWLEHRDPLFLAHWIDKPPLFLWWQTLSFAVWGPTQTAARYVNIASISLLSGLLCGYTSRRWGLGAGATAMGLATLNPLLLAYAPTGITDPLLILWSTLALLLAWERKYMGSGLALALALFTKQTAVLHVPLVLGAILMDQPQAWKTAYRQWGTGFLIVALPIQLWDMLRWFQAPSFWVLGFAHYAPLRWVPVSAWIARSQDWATLLSVLFGSWLGWLGWTSLLALACGQIRKQSSRAYREERQILWLLVWSGGYLLVHLVMTFNVWIRYLLPVLPNLILTAVWALKTLQLSAPKPWIMGAGLLALLVLGLGSGLALPQVRGQQLPEGPRNRELAGVPEALALVTSHAPAGTVLFHHELSWHYLFYLFDDNSLTRIWYENPEALVTAVQELPRDVPKIQLRLTRDVTTTEHISALLAAASLYHVRCFQSGEVAVFEIQAVATATCRSLPALEPKRVAADPQATRSYTVPPVGWDTANAVSAPASHGASRRIQL